MKKLINKILLTFLFFTPLLSQMEEGETLNGIAAVVGKQVITKAEVYAEVMTLKQFTDVSDIDESELYDKVLDNLINQNLLVTKALEDSISVTDDELEGAWRNALDRLVSRYGSEQRIENVYGKSLNRLKFEYSDQIRRNLLSQKLQQQKVAGIQANPKEVEEFYNKYKDSLSEVPQKVELYHIVKTVASDNSKKEEIQELARRVRDSILTDQLEFAEAAKIYSDDPGTKDEGGNLGWFSKGKLVPEFENAAFKLQLNEISLPVETPFGFHIIQTLDKKEDAVKTRHIVFSIKTTDADKNKAVSLLNELRNRAQSGEEFEKLAKEYSDDKDTKGFGGEIGKVQPSTLPPNMKEKVNNLSVGEISEPIKYNADPTKEQYHIIYKKNIIKPHKPDLESDYDMIQKLASARKKQDIMESYFEELREELYWEKY